MATFRQVIDDARVLLNDVIVEGVTPRYSDSQLLTYAQQAVHEARRIRPDMFLSNLTGALPTHQLTDTIPLGEEYTLYVTDFLVGRAELRDDEFAVDGRGVALMTRFKSGLLGIV
jgi:hypothetical protein